MLFNDNHVFLSEDVSETFTKSHCPRLITTTRRYKEVFYTTKRIYDLLQLKNSGTDKTEFLLYLSQTLYVIIISIYSLYCTVQRTLSTDLCGQALFILLATTRDNPTIFISSQTKLNGLLVNNKIVFICQG